jgi:phosphatidylserine decarboxylase
MSIGHSPHVEGHKPDMRKDEAHITEIERQDARRRIAGSMAPEMDNMGLPGADIATDDKAMSSLHPANIA